jgi:hypothetical protein
LFFSDPEKYKQHILKGTHEEIAQLKQAQQQNFLNNSEMFAKAKHPDYDDAYTSFKQQASVNPALVQQVLSSSNPAETAYAIGKQIQSMTQLSDAGGIDAYKEQIKQEAIAEYQESLKVQDANQAIENVVNLPKPMGSKRTMAGNGKTPEGEMSLEDILNG